MKTFLKFTALISTLITIYLLVLWALSQIPNAPPAVFLWILIAGLLVSVWLNVSQTDKDVRILELEKLTKPLWFYPYEFAGMRGSLDKEDAIEAAFMARQPEESSFAMKITTVAKVEPIFASVSLATDSEEHLFNYTIHPTMKKAEAAVEGMKGGDWL